MTLSSSSNQGTSDVKIVDMHHADQDDENVSASPKAAICQAFHPVETDDSLTVLSFKVPPIIEEEQSVIKTPRKEAYFDICLDVSGSMAGSGIQCARLAMKRLIDHLIKTCGVPPNRIMVYLFSHQCNVRNVNGDDKWIDTISANGGTSFACVFKEVIKNIKTHISELDNDDVDLETTLFFFTDGEDGDAHNLQNARIDLEKLLKSTPRLESTVHTFGFTASHDAKLLSWLTSSGSNSGCFQYIKESKEIDKSMSTTLELLGDSAMAIHRKIEINLPNSDGVVNDAQDWIPVKLKADGMSGSTVVRQRPFKGDLIKWREYKGTDSSESVVQDMHVNWSSEDDPLRIVDMATFIQHELLRLVEVINGIGSDTSQTPEQKRAKLLKIDEETEAYSKVLGTMTSTSARMKLNLTREPCMVACQRTRSLIQSFLTLKADAHKQGGSISNTSLATFNSLAYGEITEAKLKAKLDARAGKNIAMFAEMDQKVTEIVKEMDLDKMESEEPKDSLRELSCAFSTNSYVDALLSRGAGVIADPSQLIIKSIFPTYLTSSMFTTALNHSLSQNDPEDVHGGFDRNSDASIAPGLAHENITAVIPLYINAEHWKVAKLRMKPILGYVVTLDATGYTYSQSTTVPFLVLAKAFESFPMTEFKQRQLRLILETCDAIYRDSKSLREDTKALVKNFCASHTQRTVDVITNNYVFLGHIICALRAGDITTADINALWPKFETAMVEEQIRRDMSWRVSEDLMGSVMDWFDINRQRDIVAPEQQYRVQHDAYVKSLENGNANAGAEAGYRRLFDMARTEQGVESLSSHDKNPSPELPSSSTAEEGPVSKPVFKIPDFDPLTWQLSEASLDRLRMIQNAISPTIDKICRLLTVVRSPLDADIPQVLVSLGATASTELVDQFFAQYSTKIKLATLLQAFAHTRNSSRRSVENFMTPFERKYADGPDQSSDEALLFLKSLYLANMNSVAGKIVAAVEEAYMNSKENAASSIFLSADDLTVAAGVLLEAQHRGGAGGRLTTLCARSRMSLPREKIQMLLTGTYRHVKLFADKTGSLEDIRWFPCKRTLYRMFKNYHGEFTFEEWCKFHPHMYDDYFAVRYVIDGCTDELPVEKRVEVRATYESLRSPTV
ncbi:hypothetical protein BGZ65_008184 [Modicella reniformis]|uniref:VWFA domain-containing protein n=1 Tax=Modicella reniformis TaxID=1440133 RepID=A0A9P6MK54_9FUNG|nr:hypothetical protein BGZ65_008184 [Modicella reniformis]